jgi:hypothetical protein
MHSGMGMSGFETYFWQQKLIVILTQRVSSPVQPPFEACCHGLGLLCLNSSMIMVRVFLHRRLVNVSRHRTRPLGRQPQSSGAAAAAKNSARRLNLCEAAAAEFSSARRKIFFVKAICA